MALGGWLLLNSLGIVRISVWQLFWPMILIAIGTILVVQTVQAPRRQRVGHRQPTTR